MLNFLTKPIEARIITKEPKVGRVVPKVKPIDVKLKKRPIRAVIAKLNPIEKVILSIISSDVSLGNKDSVKQYPGRKAIRTNPRVYRK